jgi:hypothetical protein
LPRERKRMMAMERENFEWPKKEIILTKGKDKGNDG